MFKTGISKLEAAQRQIDWAIRLRLALEENVSVAVHTLAYAAFGILRHLIRAKGDSMAEALSVVLAKLSKMGRDFSEVPNFVKHADPNPAGCSLSTPRSQFT
jgi:hypothetical protein